MTTRSAKEICNPAWDIWRRVFGDDILDYSDGERWNRAFAAARLDERGLIKTNRLDDHLDAYRVRHYVCTQMSFAVPDPAALEMIAAHAPLIEIGAGSGYWAWCLRQMGVDVIATDKYPPQLHPQRILPSGCVANGTNGWFSCYWTEVEKMDAVDAAARYPDRTLLVVWPYMDDMAVDALCAFQGNRVIYVGEESPACATDTFFKLVDRRWRKLTEQLVPQWEGIHDELWVLERRRKR